MAEKRLSERDLRKSIREALAGNLGSIVFGGSFKVYDGGKNGIVIYRGNETIEVQPSGAYSSFSSCKSPKNVPSDK
jgi:hypothetical protein